MSGAQNDPYTVSDGAGGMFVAWSDTRFIVSDIYVQHVLSDGTLVWNANGLVACSANGRQDQPSIAPDGTGGVLVTWRDYRNGQEGDIYAQRIDPTGLPMWGFSGTIVCTAPGQQTTPVLIADGSPDSTGVHGAFIAWEDDRDAPRIYAQHLAPDGTPLWAVNGIPVSTSLAAQFEPAMVPDSGTGAIVTWAQQSADDWDVWSQRVGPDGAARWDTAGVRVCGATGDQFLPVTAADGAGGAWIAWQDDRSVALAVYAQHLGPAGLAMLPPDGEPVCVSGADEVSPAIAADGAGGLFVAWTDSRAGTDIYAQRLDPLGILAWDAGGVAVCAGSGVQAFPAAVADGSGGVIVAWEDGRTGAGLDIYAQKLDGSGLAQWTVGGLAISTAASNQYAVSAVSSGDTTAVLLWSDLRNGNVDLYAQRLPLDAGTAALATSRLLSSSPNPASEVATFAFELRAPGRGELTVFDAAGRRVRTVARSDFSAGDHRIAWDARDDGGRRCATGIYFARLVMDGRVVATRRLSITR